MKFTEYLESELSRKYKQPEDVTNMILDQKTTKLLNPAYNRKYATFIDNHKKTHLTGSWITHDQKIDTHKGEEKIIGSCFDLLGVGGIGSNLLFNLQYFLFKGEEPNQFFEYDEWELSNLPRIPFKPAHIKKKESLTKDKLGTSYEGEDDFNEPLFYEACHNIETQLIPYGAMDIATRKHLYELRAPFIAITHKDNTLQVVLCPEPAEDINIMTESYGIVDINFLLPATTIVASFVKDMLQAQDGNVYDTDGYRAYKLIDDYKKHFYRFSSNILDVKDVKDSESKSYAKCMFEAKFDLIKNKTLPNLDDVKLTMMETYKYVYRCLTTHDGIRKFSDILNIEPSFASLDMEEPDVIWNRDLKNKVLFEVTQEDVDKFLENYKK